MGKQPGFFFFPNDWVCDLQAYPLEIQGAWMRLLCQIWWQPGKEIIHTHEEYARILGVSIDDAKRIIATLIECNIAGFVTQQNVTVTPCNTHVTLFCRRWKKELESKEKQRVMTKERVQKYRQKSTVTPCNATPSSEDIPIPIPIPIPKKDKDKTAVVLPDWLDPELWEEFRQHRIALKKRMTNQAERLALKTLSELQATGQDIKLVIEQSIMRGWAGLFSINANDNPITSGDPGKKAELIKAELIAKGEWY